MDDDLLLAIRLQEQYDREEGVQETWQSSHSSQRSHKDGGAARPQAMSVVDPSWELLDPSPDVRALFLQFNEMFFWGKLAGVEVKWSPRMTLCAGVCSYEGMGGLCSIRLSKPLLVLRPRKDLVETLLHEMIHALLFVTHNNKDRESHGPEFLKHMDRINSMTGANISVYHSFHDEVQEYRKHWWRCNGPCQDRKPYFGYVKRAMNRAPSSRDPWWPEHQRTCGGTYIKVKEPEPSTQKGKSKEESAGKGFKHGESSQSVKKNIQNTISFTGKSKEVSAFKGFKHWESNQSAVKNNIHTFSSPGKSNVSAVNSFKNGESSQSVVKSNIHTFSSPEKKEEVHNNLFPGKGFKLGGTSRSIDNRGQNAFPFSGASPTSISKPPINNILKYTTPLTDSLANKSSISKVPKISVANTRAFMNVGGSPVKLPFHRTNQTVVSPLHKDNLTNIAQKRTSSESVASSQSAPSTSQERKRVGEFQPPKRPRMEIATNIKNFFQNVPAHTVTIPKKPIPERTETISSQRKVSCPVCQIQVPEADINNHLDTCLT